MQQFVDNNQHEAKSDRNGYCRNLLSNHSLGQYATKLYNKGKDNHSSLIGGILSLISGFAFSLFALYIIYETIFDRENKTLTEEIKDVKDVELPDGILYIPLMNFITEAMLSGITVFYPLNTN